MLEHLFGSKSVEKILLFLFVNGKCYGNQLAKTFHSPLTPIQKGLNRLESCGILKSRFEGKTKLYHLNPAFPLLLELEALLKKAYSLLPPEEKREYFLISEHTSFSPHILQKFWNRLGQVSKLHFIARSKVGPQGWNGEGKGEVEVEKAGSSLVFYEKGSFKGKESPEVCFSNIFRWTFDRNTNLIALEHLRRGPDHPVFLLHLRPKSSSSLLSVDSHLCEGDTYFGQVHFDTQSLRLKWRVIGPKKNEELECFYT